MKNILWLTEWWPNEIEPFSGDGIERRAKAASVYNNIVVIFVKKNPSISNQKIKFEERIYNENLKAWIYYYPSISKFSRFLDVLYSNYWFIRLHRKGLKAFKKKYGKPYGVQVNVAMKVGVIALGWHWFRKMRYIIVEGWSLFLPEAKPTLKDKSWFFRLLTKKVIRNARALVTVSRHLGEMINQNVVNVPYKIIPSVVDKTIFHCQVSAKENKTFRFIHISTLDPAKNIETILQALKKIISLNYPAELIIHAPANEQLKNLIVSMGLQQNVILKGEVQQALLADSIRSCDALILFSLYETFGNVVIESQACGVPVITSDYPVFYETVQNNKNGIIANDKTAEALAEAMEKMIKNKNLFDGKEISNAAINSYSFERIGKMLDDVYEESF